MTTGARSGVAPPLTTIIATIGPACSDAGKVAAVIGSGASVFRLNFSHGGPEEHARHVATSNTAASLVST